MIAHTTNVTHSNTIISKSVCWLRADSVEDKTAHAARRALAILVAALLTVSIIGIPLLILGASEWSRQHPQDSIPHTYRKILDIHNKIKPNPPLLRPSPFEPENPPWATMEGISVVADYLCEKNNIDTLFVCQNLDAFQKKLQEINASEEDTRMALIVPCYQSHATCLQKRCSLEEHNKPDYHSQHKIAVLIEKKEGKLMLCMMDSTGGPLLNIDCTYIFWDTHFDSTELVHSYIREANLKNAKYYYAPVQRHYSRQGGCSTFALRDAIGFLKNKNFFVELENMGEIYPNFHDGSIDYPFYVKFLPPEHMKTTQSMRSLERYAREQRHYDLSQPLGKHHRTLDESVQKHTRIVDGKKINKHIDDRLFKYQTIILDALTKLSPEELSAKINKRLL